MAINIETPLSEIDEYINGCIERFKQAVIRTLCVAGESAVNAARLTTQKQYKDQTGNLRSSVGYVVVADGKIVKMGDFDPSEHGTDKATGQRTGKEYAKQLASRFSSGLVLIVVAGMDYAV